MFQADDSTESDMDQLDQVCHDLKQHIATGLLLSDPAEGEALRGNVRERLEVMHLQWEQVAALVTALGQRCAAEVVPVDLLPVAADCVAVAAAARTVRLESDDREHVVRADLALLRRAVANLLDNACRAAGSQGQVVVRVGGDETAGWLEVADEGPGFGEIESGSGHGLAVVRAAVRTGGGRLRIESGPERGTTVRMTFPAALVRVS